MTPRCRPATLLLLPTALLALLLALPHLPALNLLTRPLPLPLAPAPPHRPPITHIAVIGERHSGTNLAAGLLHLNLDPRFHRVWANFTAPKHYLQPPPPAPHPATLVIVSVRNPYDWVLALFRICYCCEDRNRLGWDDFLHTPYQATRERPNAACPLQDVNIFDGGRPFTNLLQLRRWKLLNHLNTTRWAAGHEVVQLEAAFQNDSSSLLWLRSVAARHGLVLRTPPANASAMLPNTSSSAPGAVVAGTATHRLRHHHRRRRTFAARQAYSGLAGQMLEVEDQEEVEVRAVVHDARYWFNHTAFDRSKRVRKSLYLNRTQLRGEGRVAQGLRARVRTINELLDAEVEARVGYEVVEVPPL